MEVKHSNGNLLKEGDAVANIKSLKVSPLTIKKGTVVKNIRLTDDPEEVD